MSERPVVIVTGGGRGIGAATAKLAAARGHAVCVNFLQGREAAEDVVRYITARNGQAIAIQADISSEADVVSFSGTSIPGWAVSPLSSTTRLPLSVKRGLTQWMLRE